MRRSDSSLRTLTCCLVGGVLLGACADSPLQPSSADPARSPATDQTVEVEIHDVYSGLPRQAPGVIALDDEWLFVEILDVEAYLDRSGSGDDVRIGNDWESGTPAESFEVLDITGDERRDIRLRFSLERLIDAGEVGTGTTRLDVWGRHAGSGEAFHGEAEVQVIGGPPEIVPATIAAGELHSCGLTTAGEAYCWGLNAWGQLGDGTTENRLVPTPVEGGLRFVAISAGQEHTVAITESGEAYAWGSNWIGQLGDGTTTDRSTPVPVAGGHRFAAVSAGGSFTLALTEDGGGWAWGNNADGQLGDGSGAMQTAPVEIAGGHAFAELQAGFAHSLGLTSDGAAYAWGFNMFGQLGDGGFDNRDTPGAVAGGHRFVAIQGGVGHTVALTADGEAYAWGFNFNGQLGDGTRIGKTTPVPVAAGRRFVAISAGDYFTLALTETGAAWAWGHNEYGQLGDGTWELDRIEPVAVVGGHVFDALVAGGYHSLARTPGGAAWAWGLNGAGQLGDETEIDRNEPVEVAGGLVFR